MALKTPASRVHAATIQAAGAAYRLRVHEDRVTLLSRVGELLVEMGQPDVSPELVVDVCNAVAEWLVEDHVTDRRAGARTGTIMWVVERLSAGADYA